MATENPLGDENERYIRFEKLAEGGMGVVYKAWDTILDREVAIKLIRKDYAETNNSLRRFVHEAKMIAGIPHKNILKVHDYGEVRKSETEIAIPFIVMEFLRHGTLADRLGGEPIAAKKAADTIAKLSSAVHAAHQVGVLHRDLKPSNVMLESDGTPKLTDFGMAKQIGASNGTEEGCPIGTPSYMAPEQAAGRTEDHSPLCDVYGLGAMLYECVTGRPPFTGDTPVSILVQVISHPLIEPCKLNPFVPKDLESIILKCLDKEACNRYQTAEEVCTELERFLSGKPLKALRLNPLDRFLRHLGWSNINESFSGWDSMLRKMAWIILTSQFIVFSLRLLEYPLWYGWCAHTVQVLLLALLVFSTWIRAEDRLELQLSAIILGSLAYGLVQDVIVFVQSGSPWPFDEFAMYPHWALLFSFCFFAYGTSHAGSFYVFAVLFLIVDSMGSLFLPDFAPVFHGIVCWITFMYFSNHLRKILQPSLPLSGSDPESPTITL